jgi:tetratricopeptide (TPR) repeat protein
MKYSPENKKVFDELSGLCINKMIVPYIGAGMSVFAGFKTWNNFINNEYESCFHTKKPDNMNNIVAADLIEQEQGNDVFYENVRTTFGGNLTDAEWESILKKAENQSVSVIPKLFSGPIVTTNFDQIIEKIHDNKLPAVFPYNSEELEKEVNNRKRFIYKIHGCVSDAQNVVFTKSVYDKVYNPDSELVKSLSVFFQGFHFLFLGSSLGVTNTKVDTKDYSMDLWEQLQNSGTYHFAIIDCAKDQLSTRRKELEERNIHPILFESGEYESVRIILDELLARYENQLFGVPQYTSPFVERKESVLEKIANLLHDDEWSALVITGFGGVGKTRILSEYANRKQKAYKHIIWFNAISADNVREEIFQFALKNKLIVETEKDYNYIYYVFKKWMKENEEWLFLLDNVEHREDIKAFFDFDETLKGKRHILISSRNKDEFSNIQTITIDIFEIEESREFLKSHTNKTPDDYADKIANLLGGLPLALEQAAAYIKEENESYKGYYELLEKDTISVLEKKHLSHTESIGATWNISMQRIKSKATKELLNLCAFFAPDNIHCQWFIDAIDVLPDELRRNGLSDFTEIKKDLKAYSLVRIDNTDKVSMHRLLQDVVKNAMNDNKSWMYVDACVRIFDKQISFDFSNNKYRETFTEMTPHILSITAICEQSGKREDIEDVASFYNFLGYGYTELANYEVALEYYQKAIDIREKKIGKEHIDTAMVYNNIAAVYDDLGNYSKAQEYYQWAVDIYEKFDKKHPDTASAYDNIGLTYSKQGYYDRALECCDKALAIREKIYGKEHYDTALSCTKLGEIYEIQGNYTKSLKKHLKALSIFEKVLGKEHLDIAVAYNHIGIVYTEQGKYAKSLEYHKLSLEIREKILGKEHPDVAISYSNIGGVYDEQGDCEKALEYHEKALFIYENVFGKEHPDIATIYNNLGGVYAEQNNFDKALEHYQKALNIRKKIFNDIHTDTATSYNNIGEVYNEQGNYSKALKYHKKALSIYKKIWGEFHHTTARSYNNIGGTYNRQENYQKALEYYTKALRIRKIVLGKEHPDTATSYNNIGMNYNKRGNHIEAIKYFQKSLAVYKKIVGYKHPGIAVIFNNIGWSYAEQGHHAKALIYYKKALNICEQVLDKKHRDTANVYNNIGLVYYKQKKYKKALNYFQEALEIQEKVLAKNHPDRVTTRNNMKNTYEQIENSQPFEKWLNEQMQKEDNVKNK